MSRNRNEIPINFGKEASGREWENGLCDCCNSRYECCCATWCWPCYVYRTFKSVNEPCCSCACCPSLLWCCFCVNHVALRTKIRAERKIRGSVPGDFCTICFCTCCAMVQMSTEVRDTAPLINNEHKVQQKVITKQPNFSEIPDSGRMAPTNQRRKF